MTRFRSYRLSRSLPLAAVTVLLACSRAGNGAAALSTSSAGDPAIPARVAPSFPASWRLPAGATATFAPQAMAVSNSPEASAAAAEILKAGGNAVDAAVALGFALAVTWPEAGNIGGGGYMVIHLADGREAAIDYREIAPLAATRNMYLDAKGNPTDKSIVGHLASGVPGAVSGLTTALSTYGTMSLAQVMQPAIRLARARSGCVSRSPAFSACPAG